MKRKEGEEKECDSYKSEISRHFAMKERRKRKDTVPMHTKYVKQQCLPHYDRRRTRKAVSFVFKQVVDKQSADFQ